MALRGPGESYSDVILLDRDVGRALGMVAEDRADLSLACPHRHLCADSPYLTARRRRFRAPPSLTTQ